MTKCHSLTSCVTDPVRKSRCVRHIFWYIDKYKRRIKQVLGISWIDLDIFWHSVKVLKL